MHRVFTCIEVVSTYPYRGCDLLRIVGDDLLNLPVGHLGPTFIVVGDGLNPEVKIDLDWSWHAVSSSVGDVDVGAIAPF